MKMSAEKYIAVLDVGTTTVKCFIFDQNAQVRGQKAATVSLLYGSLL